MIFETLLKIYDYKGEGTSKTYNYSKSLENEELILPVPGLDRRLDSHTILLRTLAMSFLYAVEGKEGLKCSVSLFRVILFFLHPSHEN